MTTPTPQWGGDHAAPAYPAQPHPGTTAAPAAHFPAAAPPAARPQQVPDGPRAPGGEQPAPQPASAHRTGSPIIAPGMQPALLTAVLAALTAAASGFARPVLLVPAVLLQALTAAGWFRLNGMWPARQGIMLAFLAGLAADAGLLAASGGHAPQVLLGALGVWVLLVVAQQMRHHGSADERLASLTATSASTVLTVLAAGYLARGGHAVLVGAVAVGVAVLFRALPLPPVAAVVLALAAATGAGLLTVRLADLPASAVWVAAAAGVCALVGLRVASYDWPSRFVHFTAGVALPLALAAPAVHLLGRALGI